MDTSICGSSLSNNRDTIEVSMSISDMPQNPILTRQNAFVQPYCIVCNSPIPLFLVYTTKLCSSNCYNILYHDSQILCSINYYENNYNFCKKLLYEVLPEDLANLILEYHDYNLAKYSDIKLL